MVHVSAIGADENSLSSYGQLQDNNGRPAGGARWALTLKLGEANDVTGGGSIMYGTYDPASGGSPIRDYLPYTFTPETRELISRAAAFLYSIKSINVEKLRADAIEPQWTEQILKERGLKAPIGEVKALPDAQAPKE